MDGKIFQPKYTELPSVVTRRFCTCNIENTLGVLSTLDASEELLVTSGASDNEEDSEETVVSTLLTDDSLDAL